MCKRDELIERRDDLRKQITAINEAIAEIDPLNFYAASKFEGLQSIRTLRERELQEVEAQLVKGG